MDWTNKFLKRYDRQKLIGFSKKIAPYTIRFLFYIALFIKVEKEVAFWTLITFILIALCLEANTILISLEKKEREMDRALYSMLLSRIYAIVVSRETPRSMAERIKNAINAFDMSRRN